MPQRPDTLFVWQVAVHSQARGQGLGVRMLDELVLRLQPGGVTHMETTITRDNEASWAMFGRHASNFSAAMDDRVFFDREQHFQGSHDSEYLVRIGPYGPRQ